MEEQVQTLVEAVLAAESEELAVETYMAAPKNVRRVAYSQIRAKNSTLGKRLRTAAEKQRGIAFRTADGTPVFAKDQYVEQITRLKNKEALMDERKARLGARVVELKKQAQEIYGDDFLAELETALEQA